MLLWDGEPLVRLIGMCGWLPFAGGLAEVVGGSKDGKDGRWEDGFDPFDREVEVEEAAADTSQPADRDTAAIRYLQEILELDAESLNSCHARCLCSHHYSWGMEARMTGFLCNSVRSRQSVLKAIDVEISWNEYQGLGRWYSGYMLADNAHFLQSSKGYKMDKTQV